MSLLRISPQTDESISKAEGAEEQALKEAQIEANKKSGRGSQRAGCSPERRQPGLRKCLNTMLAGFLAARLPPISMFPATLAAMDTAAPTMPRTGGTEIYAVSGGVVTAAAYHYSWGYYVQVYHGKDDNGNSYSTLYAP